jgi:hypothetical protein
MGNSSDAEIRSQIVVRVNESEVTFHDHLVTGRDILSRVGFDPASDHILIRVADCQTLVVGLDEEVRLRPNDNLEFRATLSDRTYALTINERGYVWASDAITTAEIRHIAEIPDDVTLILERTDEPDEVLLPSGAVELKEAGTEHIKNGHRPGPDFVLVTVFVPGGVYPMAGAVKVEVDTLVSNTLQKAAKKLELGDTSGWIVSSGGRDIDPNQSYRANGLTGHVELDWHLREGGGGHA